MTRPHTKHQSYSTCSCGQVMYGSINKQKHLESTRHLYGTRIIAQLEAGATLTEVGNKFGITRERVRQIAKALGARSATERVRERTEQRALEEFFNRLPHTRLGRFLEAARRHGCTGNQLVPLTTSRHLGQYYRDRVWVGGKLVVVKASHGFRHGNKNLVSIHNTAADVDYAAYELLDGRWLILPPWGALAERSYHNATMFTLKEVLPGSKGYTYTKRHDFREGIEAWHLFTNGDK